MTDKEFIQGVIKGDFNGGEIVDRYKEKTNGKPFYADLVEAWSQTNKMAGVQSAAATISYALLEIEEIMMGGRIVFEQREDGKTVPIFVKDSEPQQAGKDKPTEPQQSTIPDELNTPTAKALLQKAINADLCTEDFVWLKSKALLAYFGERAGEYLGICKGEYNGNKKANWQPFERLFNVKDLRYARSGYSNRGRSKPYGGRKIVDALFEPQSTEVIKKSPT